MKKWVMIFAVLASVVLNAEESPKPVDLGRIRVSITNCCAQAVLTEHVWEFGQAIKSKYSFSDAQMTELLEGCIPMVKARTDYKVSHYHLFGLFERTCGTNAIPVLVSVVRENKNDYDVRYAYAAYCVLKDMDESCFTLGSEILDSANYGEWSRWAVYSRIGRRREKAVKSGDQVFLQRCELFYRSRQSKDVDFRKHVGYQNWPGPDVRDGGSK